MMQIEQMQTGAAVVAALRAKAHELNIAITKFVRPLTTDPTKFLIQLEAAAQPKPATIARVQALIDGRTVPPLLAYKERKPARPENNPGASGVKIEPRPVGQMIMATYREPCPFCAIRADIGCRHRRFA